MHEHDKYTNVIRYGEIWTTLKNEIWYHFHPNIYKHGSKFFDDNDLVFHVLFNII